jgi:hypothetical protein
MKNLDIQASRLHCSAQPGSIVVASDDTSVPKKNMHTNIYKHKCSNLRSIMMIKKQLTWKMK